MQRLLAAAVLIGGLILLPSQAARAADAEPAKEVEPGKEIAGEWSVFSVNGEKQPHADDPDHSTLLTFDVDGGTWKLEPRSDDNGQGFAGSYIVDPMQTPKLLDVVIQGDGGNTDIFGIYKVEADELTIHFRNDAQRPGDFQSGTDGPLLVFKRYPPK